MMKMVWRALDATFGELMLLLLAMFVLAMFAMTAFGDLEVNFLLHPCVCTGIFTSICAHARTWTSTRTYTHI